MNYRQIRMLNNLEENVDILKEQMEKIIALSNMDWIKVEARLNSIEKRIAILENPPKRPRGRPRKVNAE